MKTQYTLAMKWAGLAVALSLTLAGCKSTQSKSTNGSCCPQPMVGAPATPATPAPDAEESLFDGKTLKGWRVTDFAGKGDVEVKDGKIIMHEGVMTGINYTNEVPKMNYEVNYEASRISGSDFFASLTFPVDDSFCTLITGGWGGGVVGISSLDNHDASENETTQYLNFENEKWYHFRIRVTPKKLEAWIDDKKVVNVDTTGRTISVRPGEIEASKPFGFATWATGGALKNIKLKRLD
jgi:hypothetical protein